MVRWRGLTEHLSDVEGSSVTLSYTRVAELIGGPLPPSAHRWRPQFWANAAGNGYARIWRDVGFKTNLSGLPDDQVRFVRVDSVASTPGVGPVRSGRRTDPADRSESADVVLVGCVKSKLAVPAVARELYTSPLWLRRRRYAEDSGKPWLILSAEHGVLAADEVVEPYDRYLADEPVEYRQAWGRKVVRQLEERLGHLTGKVFELHAGRAYGDPIEPLLRSAGATLVRPLSGLTQGRQLQWYEGDMAAEAAVTPHQSQGREDTWRPPVTGATPLDGMSRRLTDGFVRGLLDLSARPGAPPCGWPSMPEVRAVGLLREHGASASTVRTFLTLVAAVDRARDADRLWDAGAALYKEEPWVYAPAEVRARSLTELADALRRFGVTQRHGVDTFAWRTISESLEQPSPVQVVIDAGRGTTADLLNAVRSATEGGSPRYPLLRGEKISTMWIRLLAYPGEAQISGLDQLPVAVDVQVRKVTEYLGVAETHGLDLDRARPHIQRAWHQHVDAHGAAGPEKIADTCAALDPALWFFAKWGCTTCERRGRRHPVHEVCGNCRFDELRRDL